jgi:predicted nucleic acid-binding protein
VTVLDASLVIAVLDGADAHHEKARDAVRALVTAGEPLACSPITLAEVLVGPARSGRLIEAERSLGLLGIVPVPLPADAPSRLARLRTASGMRLPDCCVLLAALQAESALITFDGALATAATRLGLRALPG